MMVRALKAAGSPIRKKVIIHIVAEEETGGSGTLALIRRGEAADLCINLEPCSLRIMTSVRGAVWFALETQGEAGHCGSADPKSALKAAIEAMDLIEEYHEELLRKTRERDPLFAEMADPMPVTFGKLAGGGWPSMVPASAALRGVFGFLTTPKEEVMEGIASRLRSRSSPWLQAHHTLRFPYRHDMSRVDPDLPAVRELSRAFRLAGLEGGIGGLPASSDAWFYSRLLGVPAVCTGCGDLFRAHSPNERVRISDIASLAFALALFIAEGITPES
jgi:acetylornithine deacetylase